MKKSFKLLSVFLGLLVLLSYFGNISATEKLKPSKNILLKIGDFVDITNEFDGSEYSSSNTKIAQISNEGVVNGINIGEAIISSKTKSGAKLLKVYVQAPSNVKVFNNKKDLVNYFNASSKNFTEKFIIRAKIKLSKDEKENNKLTEAFLPKPEEIGSVFLTNHEISCLYNFDDSYVDFSYTLTYSEGAAVMRSLKDKEIVLTKDQKVLKNALETILKDLKITEKTPKYQKALLIHDYIVLNYKYQTNKEFTDSDYKALGLITKKTGVCQAYSEVLYLLLNMSGVECEYVTGTLKSAGTLNNHSWNRVKLDDDKWYFIDATADDPMPDKVGRVNHNYFALTDKQLSKTHDWDKTKSKNICDSTKYNYKNILELLK